MNLNLRERQWMRWSGTAMLHWEKLMNGDMATAVNKYEELRRKRPEKHRIVKEEARQEVDEISNIVEQLKTSNKGLLKHQKSLSKKGNQRFIDEYKILSGKQNP